MEKVGGGITERQLGEEEWTSLRFAWFAGQHVKSKVIVLVQGGATVGIVGGKNPTA